MEVAAVPRTYPISLIPSPCKAATMKPNFSTRWPKLSNVRTTLASKLDRPSATTIVEPRKNQKFYLSEDEEEMETDNNFIERLELLEEQALRIGNDSDDSDEGGGGREATDYNRRAQIFDKCSKVFQALKHGE